MNDVRFLDPREGSHVFSACSVEERRDLLMAVSVWHPDELVFYRGDGRIFAVPRQWFIDEMVAKGHTANLDDVRLIDYGNGVAFGDFEFATDAILYEFDPEYKAWADDNTLL